MIKEDEQKLIKFTESFQDGTRQDWMRLVEESLKGTPLESLYSSQTYEGFELKPIYGDEDNEVKISPFSQGVLTSKIRQQTISSKKQMPWDICQYYSQPAPDKVNLEIQDDINGAITSISILFAYDLETTENAGVRIESVSDFESLFKNVNLTTVKTVLNADQFTLPLSGLFSVFVQKNYADPSLICGSFGGDPFGTLAKTGSALGSLNTQLEATADLAIWAIDNMPGMRAFLADTSIYYEGGVTETEDIAIAISVAVEYLRVMTGKGISFEKALEQLSFRVSVGTNVFQTISKLRALRVLWDQIIEICSQSKNNPPPKIEAIVSRRVLSSRDVSVNMLRATCACFSAVVGGAETITLLPHTHLIRQPTLSDRRLSRNIQNILMHESFIAKVADPAGGSFYVESLTNSFAQRSWEIFQKIEGQGGFSKVLMSGGIHEMAEYSWNIRKRNLDNRDDTITGVSSFPDLNEGPITREEVQYKGLRQAGVTTKNDKVKLYTKNFADFIGIARKGLSLGRLAQSFGRIERQIPPINTHRHSEAFEALRDQSDAWLKKKGNRPLALIARLGLPADYTSRVVFSKSYLAAGGIDTVEADMDITSPTSVLEKLHPQLIVICSSDEVYGSSLEQVLGPLREGTSNLILLAKNPADREQEYKAWGVDKFIFEGDTMLRTLKEIANDIGMNR